MHKSLIFFLRDEGVALVPQREYARLLRGESSLSGATNTTVRVADWYVEVTPNAAPTVLNETYSVLHFDEAGQVDWPRCRIGGPRNSALYEALRNSRFDDPDDDPAVRNLRDQMCDEVSWLPNSEERTALLSAAQRAAAE